MDLKRLNIFTVNRNLMKFKKDKDQVLYLEWNNSKKQYNLDTIFLETKLTVPVGK